MKPAGGSSLHGPAGSPVVAVPELPELSVALYLLPLYGWLMLAGSFARGKPFLWAVLPPVIFAIMESFVGFTTHFSISKVIWEFILRRLAAGTAPITFSADMGEGSMQAGYAGTRFAANFGDVIGRLGTADLWIGVGIGIAFLAGAVWLRRYRYEGEAARAGGEECHVALHAGTGAVVSERHPAGWRAVAGRLRGLWRG